MKSVSSFEVDLLDDGYEKDILEGECRRSRFVAGEIGGNQFGVWEITPGKFRATWEPGRWESFTVLSGFGTITDEDGTVHILKPGVIVVVGPGTAIWDIRTTLRKTWAIPERKVLAVTGAPQGVLATDR